MLYPLSCAFVERLMYSSMISYSALIDVFSHILKISNLVSYDLYVSIHAHKRVIQCHIYFIPIYRHMCAVDNLGRANIVSTLNTWHIPGIFQVLKTPFKTA
ncbi:hypothetical protein GDO81_005190 [Engystomops pustulosus]|uniref:Uncharacterized protein n=1 Tax=Engystomops pustulosus TaxID=76066 RepID=A0AAV7CLJ3_ENGPU|nr:hypothetical protein GDO81_005190 [Engystomops pustulosus]